MRDRRGECRVLVGYLMERNLMEDQGVDGRLILKWLLKTWDGGGMDLIDAAQLTFGFHKIWEIPLLDYQGGLCSLEI
jgi:hypothetical protein